MTTELTKAADAIAALQSARTQRPAAQTEREAFEAWYAEDANKQTGKPGWFTPKSIAELRDGDGYGEHRVMLNGKWEGWQARASLPAPQQATPEPVVEIVDLPRGYPVIGKLGDICSIRATDVRRGDILYTRPAPGVPEGFTLGQIADACVQAEISGSKFESLSIALAAQAKGADPEDLAAAGVMLMGRRSDHA